ncbi:MAG TPA: PAS domain-containing protein, partial [Acidovorax sp.]|nr:PAS domain-containing protein [Acidovorax sp.]
MRAILPYVLMVMDETADVALVEQALGRASVNCTLQCVKTDAQMRDALSSAPPDIVLSAFNLQHYSGLEALQLARSLCPQVPFIFVSAAIGEENAIHALRSGATDYVLKHDMARLAPAVVRALNEAALAREQKRMQEALQHSELRFRLAASTGDVWDWHVESGLAQISSQWKARLGYEDREIENTATAWLALLEPSDRERVLQAFAAHIRHRVPYDIEYRALARDGSYRWSHAKGQAVWNENGRATYMAGSVVDITERKNAELKVKRLNRIYAVLSSINSLIVRTQDRVELFREACQIAVSAGGFRLAWIGVVNEDRTKVDVVAWAGAGEDYMEYLPFGLDSQAPAYGLVGQCMQLGETLLVQDVKKDTRVALKHEAISRGFQSFGLFPLSVQHEPRGLMTLYS